MAGHRADMMKLLKRAKKCGCSVERRGSGHWKITTPSGVSVIAAFSPRTAGGYRSTINDLRKAGVQI